MPMSADELLTQLRWRYATKQFDPSKKIPADLWAKLEDAMLLSPSSFGLQPWKFVVVTDPAVRAKLLPVAWNQPQVTTASHLVVFAVKKGMGVADVERHVARVAEVRGVTVESLAPLRDRIAGTFARLTPEQTDVWMSRQVMIATGVFLASAAVLGIDACPMEGFQPDQFDAILGLKERGYGSVVIATAGYRSPDDKYASAAKVRFPREQVVEHV